MKPSISLLPIATLILSVITLPAFAGPGPQYWQAQSSAAATRAVGHVAPAYACPGAKEVPVIAKIAAWPNGKGPLLDKKVGTKRVCTICKVTAAVRTGWANGRGPVTQADPTATGGGHDCTSACGATKS